MRRTHWLCTLLMLGAVPFEGFGEDSPSASGALNMDSIHTDSQPLFMSEAEVQRRLVDSSRPCIACGYADSPSWVERSVAVLDEQLELARARGGELDCHEPLIQALFVDSEPFPRDLQSRLPRLAVSLIGEVLELRPGWLFGSHAAAQVARLRVDIVLRSRQIPLEPGSEILVRVPYGEFRAAEARLCTERGWWPMVSVGDRLLVNGMWGRVPPESYLQTIDMFRIVDGQILESGLPDVELGAWTSEERLVREAASGAHP